MMYQKDIHFAPELEDVIIGCCLLEKSAISKVYGILTPEMFYSSNSKAIFKTIIQLFENNVQVEILTVLYKLLADGISKIGDSSTAYFLTNITSNITSTASIEFYAYTVKNMWIQREIIRITTEGVDLKTDVREQISKLYDNLQKVQGTETQKEWMDMSELIMSLYKHRDEMKTKGGKGITTGFSKLDEKNGGFTAGQMIVIGARPSVGKSALSGTMAIAMAKENKSVGIISLEMNNNEIAARLASLETDIEFWRIYRNIMIDETHQENFYKQVAEKLAGLPIYISDKTKVNIHEIKSKALKLKAKGKLDVLIIDYIQLVDGDSTKNSIREQEVSRISRGIKLMAMEMQIPVIVLCQLNRQITGRTGPNRFPMLSDLRESGAIEQDADVVMFLHRDFMSGQELNESGFSTELEADLFVRKWRNAELVHIKLNFDPPKMKFSETEFTSNNNIPGNYKPYKQADDEQTRLYIQKGGNIISDDDKDKLPF